MTRGSFGFGRVAIVCSEGMTNATVHPSPVFSCATGAVMAIFIPSRVPGRRSWATGAVMAIFRPPSLPPKM